uniref:Uncharacterized protein n=1 Tax=Dunaliella tertiolecta TaxID=3047 RepID=A0A7S3QNE8_DUNTE|eukprot:1160890-Pelagomonas_calceolata.AAC.2
MLPTNAPCLKHFILPLRLPCRRDATLIVLTEAGHFVFLDKQTLLQQSACNLGKADPARVRAASALSLLSFANLVASDGLFEVSGCDAVGFKLSWMFGSAGLKYEMQTK